MDVSPLGSRPTMTTSFNSPTATENKASGSVRPTLFQHSLELLSGQSLADEKASFSEDLDTLFRQAGISVPPDALLKGDWTGAVRVANPHPQQDKIEQLFRDKPELQQRFVKIASGERLARAVENHKRVMQEYERLKGNVEAQRVLIEREVAYNKAPYFMRVGEDGIHSLFGFGSAHA